MGVILSTKNALLACTAADIKVSGPSAAGFSVLDLVRGDLDRAWLAGGPATIWDLDVRLPAGVKVVLAAIFDVRPSPVSVQMFADTVFPIATPVPVRALSMNSRGDGAFILAAPLSQFSVRYRLTFASSVIPSVGKLWLGDPAWMPAYFLSQDDAPSYAAIRNETETGGAWAHELADLRERFTLSYNNVTAFTHDGIRAAWQATRGGTIPSLLMPSEAEPSRVYFGRLGQEWRSKLGVPGIRSGMALGFEESGRGIVVG